jgi:hypothetical protein
MRGGFTADILAALDAGKGLRIRAGSAPHRFIGIWVVVVDGRVFVRSWSIKPKSWYRTFLKDPIGAIEIDAREIAVHAVPARGARLNDAIDRAYRAKYSTPASVKYARDLGSRKSRATTTELLPAKLNLSSISRTPSLPASGREYRGRRPSRA